MEDLGPAARGPGGWDAARLAGIIHAADPPPGLLALDEAGLARLPTDALDSLTALRARGRWTDATDVAILLTAATQVAPDRAEGARLAPFGLCHGEFHPTSLHVGDRGPQMLDWARVFVGPGLLDLASWHGTTRPVDPDALADLIALYRRTGGAHDILAPRAGLPPAAWALGWHRLWVATWYLDQANRWINNPDHDATVQQTVRRHLAEAATCLNLPVSVL